MAGIQDPLTDLPPPSRLDFDELSNFNSGGLSTPPPPPAFISWASAEAELQAPLHPRLLFIASSPSGLHLVRNLSGKRLLGSVVLPAESHHNEDNRILDGNASRACFSDDGNLKRPSVYDARNPGRHSAHVSDVYSLDGEQASVVMVAVQGIVAEERVHSWATVVLQAIVADKVIMVDMVQREHFRGKLSPDDNVAFRLETDAMRVAGLARAQQEMRDPYSNVPYFPSGSLVSGLPAAVLTRCQLVGRKARLLLSWPETGTSAPSFLAAVLQRFSDTKDLDFGSSLQFPFKGKSVSDLDLYF